MADGIAEAPSWVMLSRTSPKMFLTTPDSITDISSDDSESSVTKGSPYYAIVTVYVRAAMRTYLGTTNFSGAFVNPVLSYWNLYLIFSENRAALAIMYGSARNYFLGG